MNKLRTVSRYFINAVLAAVFCCFIGGLVIMWGSELSFFMCYIVTVLGAVGLLWIWVLVYDRPKNSR